MAWQVEGTDEFAGWFLVLNEDEQFYAFDLRRAAILLLGGDKTGNNRWYDENIPVADDRYDDYLRELEKEGLI
jgi:hypothetical protein